MAPSRQPAGALDPGKCSCAVTDERYAPWPWAGTRRSQHGKRLTVFSHRTNYTPTGLRSHGKLTNSLSLGKNIVEDPGQM